ncbi:TolC family outer membrane protein [Cysteiniphilum sp. JM-1]|uniref:TolC family outer membrane protein n=1 Tax=Cysteiniphilum sp. JM-1 TaxID=2610891 RepID=UPI00124849BA|nr:TolC family outer membrane protein [Cysteiniphilum sp. JM-1]
MKKITLIMSGLLVLGYASAEPSTAVVPAQVATTAKSSAADAPQTQAQNLSGIYQLAQKQNAQYLAAEATFNSSQEAVPAALGKLLPNITLGYNAQGNYSSSANASEGQKSKYFTQSPSLTATQALFNWGAWGGYNYASYQAKADAITFAMAQASLITNVASAYFAVLQAQDNLAYAEANQSWNKELLSQTQEKYKVGLSAITDVQAIKAQYEQAVAATVQAKNDLATSYAALSQIIGQSVTAVENLSDKFPFDKPDPDNMDKWMDIALKQNYNIVQNQFLLEAAKAGVSGLWGNFLPAATLTAKASRGLSYQNTNYTSGSNSASVGVGVSWNVLNGGSDYASLKQQQYTKEASKYTLLEAERATESQLKTAYLTVLSDIAQVEAYKQAVIAAEASVKAMKAGYEVGTHTIVDLLQQQQQLFQAQQQYAQAKYDYINDLLTLKNTAGVISYKDIDAINKWLTADKVSTKSSSKI